MNDNKCTESKQNIYKAESSKVCIHKSLLYKYVLAQSRVQNREFFSGNPREENTQ